MHHWLCAETSCHWISLWGPEQAKTCQDSPSDHPDRIGWDLFNAKFAVLGKKHTETMRNLIRVIPNHLAPFRGFFRSKCRLKAKGKGLFQRLIAQWKAMLNRTRFVSSVTSLLGLGVLDAATNATVWLDTLAFFFQRWSLLREVRDHAANGLTMLGWSQKDLGPGIWNDESVVLV